jgi:hypothetical protein
MAKQKLTVADLMEIENHCEMSIQFLSETSEEGFNLHLNKCLAHVFLTIKVKAASKLASMVDCKGCSLKLNEIQKQAIYHIRNEKHFTGSRDNGVVRLLEMNIK